MNNSNQNQHQEKEQLLMEGVVHRQQQSNQEHSIDITSNNNNNNAINNKKQSLSPPMKTLNYHRDFDDESKKYLREEAEKESMIEFTDKLYLISNIVAGIVITFTAIYGILAAYYGSMGKSERVLLLVSESLLVFFLGIMLLMKNQKTARLLLVMILFFTIGATCSYFIQKHIG
jgi:hypothetical protein